MAPVSKIASYDLNLAGEYRVASELVKRGIFATVTYGNRKDADIYAIGNGKALKIEVKTSQQPRFVTSITQKGLDKRDDAPDIWVLFHLKPLPEGRYLERFFILSNAEICRAQKKRNANFVKRYKAKHGKAPDYAGGVDNVLIPDVEKHEDCWEKIAEALP